MAGAVDNGSTTPAWPQGREYEETAPMPDFNETIIAEFRANAGQVGGPFAGAPILLLHTHGRRTGQVRINPMMYLPDEEHDRLLVFASKGGHPTNPDWYLNLLADPERADTRPTRTGI
jgi:hypothetical protein